MHQLPKDCDYKRLLALLKKFGYQVIRQKGSHIRLYSEKHNHNITIPAHNPIKVGTLNSIVADISNRTGETKEKIISNL